MSDRAVARRYLVWRIVGNDLPPRHAPGATFDHVRTIVEHEPALPNYDRRWLLNRIVNPEVERALLRFLESRGESVSCVPFDPDGYRSRAMRYDRLCYGIGINAARNEVLRRGFAEAEYVLPADAGTIFTREAWAQVVSTVERYEREGPTRYYFAIPMERTVSLDDALSPQRRANPMDEPQVMFRRGAELRFDETLRYGHRDKVDLLLRLGRIPGYIRGGEEKALRPHVYSPNEAMCPDAGYVIRVPAGDVDAALRNSPLRGTLRSEALDAFARALDSMTGRPDAADWESTDDGRSPIFDVTVGKAEMLINCAASCEEAARVVHIGTAECDGLDAVSEGARRASASLTTITTRRLSGEGLPVPEGMVAIDRLFCAADLPQLELIEIWRAYLPYVKPGGMAVSYRAPNGAHARSWTEVYRECIRGNDQLRLVHRADDVVIVERI